MKYIASVELRSKIIDCEASRKDSAILKALTERTKLQIIVKTGEASFNRNISRVVGSINMLLSATGNTKNEAVSSLKDLYSDWLLSNRYETLDDNVCVIDEGQI